MKSFIAAFAFLLTITTLLFSQAQSHLDSGYCCKKYVMKPIPRRLLESYDYASSKCSLPAVVFTTKANRRQCADPSAAWTQERIQSLSQTSTTPSKK
ncbi:C-C motif chemokine 5-like [Podarcis raffonei]|uniref:C-C motif chemokine 5-like n=1 Tax=Podarcis raffonei TaxID=65483 RepID=UPI0023298273|nr:C-C motif chemokine 5-like [Podarcis raffonei]